MGEGFSAFETPRGGGRARRPFRISISIEKDQVAHETLRLRAFFRNLARENVSPSFYYKLVRHHTGVLGTIGGLRSLVLKHGGSRELRALDEAESETLCATLGSADPRIPKRLRGAIDGRRDWVLIGGPPCQAYSVVGRSRNKGNKGYRIEDDPRSHLYREYLKVIAGHSPSIFVMENVKGMLSAKLDGRPVIDKIISDLRRPSHALGTASARGTEHAEYEVLPVIRPESGRHGRPPGAEREFVVRSECHGIPQRRHRVILLGVRSDVLAASPAYREGDWHLLPAGGPCPTVKDAIHGLPRVASFISTLTGPLGKRKKADGDRDELKALMAGALSDRASHPAWKWLDSLLKLEPGTEEERIARKIIASAGKIFRSSPVPGTAFCRPESPTAPRPDTLQALLSDPKLGGVANHEARRHLDRDLVRYLFAACFAAVKGRTPTLDEFPKALAPKHKSAGTGHFNDRFRVQTFGLPATTITSHISKDGHYFIHPDPGQCRSLTVREAARIQTFRDNYFFCGERTSQFHQVGNAVPPLLAEQLAGCVWRLLEGVV